MPDTVRIIILAMLLCALPRLSCAQFLQRNDSVVHLLKGESAVPSRLNEKTAEEKKNKKRSAGVSHKKEKKKAAKKKSEKKKGAAVKSKSAKKNVVDSVKYNAPQYRLGQRVIMRGDSGRDVKSLANILVKRLFLDEKDIIYTADGGVLYDGEIVRAVLLFQKVSGLYEDGMVGTPTLKALRKRK